jgi:hypothetical protein
VDREEFGDLLLVRASYVSAANCLVLFSPWREIALQSSSTRSSGGWKWPASSSPSNLHSSSSSGVGFALAFLLGISITAGVIGDVGRDTLRGPRISVFDASLLKEFPIAEAANIEFRWEVFNVANTPRVWAVER